MKRFALALLFCASPLCAQTTLPDPWKAVAFLDGTWEARARGRDGATSTGRYTFRRDLRNHVLARHSSSSTCTGPADFDCDHGDLLYVYQEAQGQSLKAIYFDNEGHVIHYAVTTPAPGQVVMVSEPAPGPRFRLMYTLDGSVMSGKFQMQMPGADAWNSYLEWSGSRE